MRRGHPGIGGWRGENPRHFRPRGGQPPHFRPPMQYGSQEPPRFSSGPRFRGTRPFIQHSIHSDDGPPGQERPFRGPGYLNNQPRSQGRGGNHDDRDRQIIPHRQNRMQDHHIGSYNKSQMYYEGNSYNTNNMGDVDHRSHDVDLRPRDIDLRSPNKYGSPWMNQQFDRRQYHNDKGLHKTPKQHGMGDSLLPPPDLTGHRPPSSDHYSGTSGPNNNNNPYSRSVDDTVDIVRRRLMNRDSTDHTDQSFDQREFDTDMRKNANEPYHDIPQEQPVKKRVQRHRQEKINCDKMKNKIVHQLFKMDKGKIHKLMDNPNSSSKFEYAISSLITESQNSFNRHLRSVAEKSLTTNNTRSDFIHDDNNTIYEDTFMRQMQGVLDPQDTVLLEDIKPLVLAELSKVLCLDDFECVEDIGRLQKDNSAYYNDQHEFLHSSYNEYNVEANHESEVITGDLYEDRNFNISQQQDLYSYSQHLSFEEESPLFERRAPKQAPKCDDRSRSGSTESWQPRRSMDSNAVHNKSNEEIKDQSDEPPRPLFDGNCDHLSDDDDPFADLDNQYHVAVDHTFIEQEEVEIMTSFPEQNNHESKSPHNVKPDINVNPPVPSAPSNDIIKEIDTQLQSIAKSPIKLLTTDAAKVKSENLKIKQEIQENVADTKETLKPKSENEKLKVKLEPMTKADRDPVKQADSGNRYSRKRSVDTKPAHRKEKRKKSSHSESHEEATSIYNMFYVQKPSTKDDKNDTADKKYSDKYVKRKESHSKDKSCANSSKSDTQKKQNSHSSHSNTSPKTSSVIGDQTPSKIDKTKLTTIDIFSDGTKPKKGVHLAHRNTSTPLAVAKSPDENKIKPIIPTVSTFARKLTKRHMGTQCITRLRHKECQTAPQKKINSGTQTSPVKFQKNHCESTEPLERMKEIDMEIQMLLQEKFKLYNSLESKNKNMSSSSAMGTLGMAVLNVPLETDENKDDVENVDFLADSIAEEFTNLPVEELEQIAMESFEDNKSSGKLSRREKVRQMDLLHKKSVSPNTRKKKSKIDTPNISLLEEIISNDRPLEEIISLDDLERTPKRSKKKSVSKPPKKKPAKKANSKPFIDLKSYNIKECSVVLEHLNVSAYLKKQSECLKIKINLKDLNLHNHETDTDKISKNTEISEDMVTETILAGPEKSSPESQVEFEQSRIEPVEETNDIQIDMMEVCEDIVIGDETKTVSDVNERIPISEEIILDNSQSSVEYCTPEIVEGECKMYDYSTDETLKRDAVTVTGNADAVLAIECIDNSFIAACLDGNVYHFSTDGNLVSTLRGSNLAVTCLTIVKEKYGTTVYTGSLDSRIRYYDLETGLEKGPECNVLSPIQTMDRAWDTIFVGTRTGFVLQFECKNNMLIPVSTVKFSEQSILALRAMKEGPRKVLLVAARSDNVTVKDAQTGLLLRTLEGPKMTVYSLLFEDGKVYCGTSSHQIHVFDYVSGSHVHVHEGGKGAVCLRATGGLVFAGCYDGCVYVYREGESRPLAQLRGPALMLLSLAIQGTKIIAGYKDRSLYIWKIPLAVLQEMIL